MRIAMIAPLAIRVPPKGYGGTERMVHALTEELVARGHDVTLFASGDSSTSAKLVSVHPMNLRDARVKNPYDMNVELLHSVGRAYAKHREFDIIHDHTRTIGLPFTEMVSTPVIMTIHCHLHSNEMPLYHEFRKANLIAISHSMAKEIMGFNIAGVIHHGLSMEHYPFSAWHEKYLLYVGRICQEKGTREAILLAKRMNLPLIIAAKVEESERGHRYYRKYVKPHMGGTISWIGEVDEVERNLLMSRAYAFVHPAPWQEPFGLTLIEAMACGAPVLALNRGSIPEIIEKGKSGLFADDVETLATIAKKELPNISRSYTRAYVLRRFNARRMTDDYERLYHSLVRKARTTQVVDPTGFEPVTSSLQMRRSTN